MGLAIDHKKLTAMASNPNFFNSRIVLVAFFSSNGMDIFFNVAFKPVATIMKPQETINQKGHNVTMRGKGRHDPCVVPRAVPIVEAMAAIVLADFTLLNRNTKK